MQKEIHLAAQLLGTKTKMQSNLIGSSLLQKDLCNRGLLKLRQSSISDRVQYIFQQHD